MTIEQTRLQLQPVLAELARVARGVNADQTGRPTPDAQWSVGQLEGHIIGWLENFADGFSATDGTCPSADPGTPEVAVDELPGRIEAAAAKLDAAVAGGATQRPLVIQGQGGMPGDQALGMILAEYQVHGWDLATATGQSVDLPEDGLRASREFLGGMVQPEYRGEGGMFAAEVPMADDASALDRLIGFSGRDPHWRA